MGRVNKEIKENPSFFDDLLKDEKTILSNVIQLDDKVNNPKWKIGRSVVRHNSIDKEIALIVEKSKREAKYGIKLRCNSYTEEPFLRFDSDGPAHRNSFREIPLEDQAVTTPHFNSFLNDGRPFAYKNEKLKDEAEAKVIVEDENFGLVLFCKEANCILNSGDFPSIEDHEPELPFELENNINFDQIRFE